MRIINLFKKKNFVDSIDTNKISETELNKVADIAFSSDHLKNENRNQVLEDGRTLEQTIKDSYKNALKSQQDSPNPKFHRTPREQQLSFEFSQKYSLELQEMENEIYDLDEEVVKLRKSKKYASKFTKEEKIIQCNKEINEYNKLKKFCYDKGLAGKIYFQDMWEYCHYDWDDCFEFIKSTKKYLNELIKDN